MTILKGKRGTWLNQYARPSAALFVERAADVDYVVIKYGMTDYERLAQQHGIPWLGERMGESGAGSQNGPSEAARYAQELANQANQPGCIGAVINLEEADGGWHTDNGTGTRRLISDFRAKAPGKPLFASLDTRGSRPNSPYQRACAELCDGVMPMVYPGAFGQSAPTAFAAAITPLVRQRWGEKDIIPTYQTYSPPPVDVPDQMRVVQRLYDEGVIDGANSYTLGHATEAQWRDSLAFVVSAPQPAKPVPDVVAALIQLREAWVKGWHAIEQRGTVGEAAAYAQFWEGLTGE